MHNIQGEHKIYILLNVLTFMLWPSTKKDKHKLQRITTALMLLSNGNSILSVEGFRTVACYRNLSVIL